MKVSRLTLANLIIGLILLTSPFLVQLTSSAPYDPWADLDADGDIDIFDIVSIAGRYATTGDPGKNVSVTNWPTKQTMNISLAHNVVIPEQSSIQLSADVVGYDRLTLVIVKQTSGVLMISVHYKFGEVYTPSVWSTPDLPGGSNFILSDSIVIGPKIWIEMTTTDFAVTVSVALYATETSR